MGQTVYVDLLFLINFSMDFLCFYLSSRILCRRLDVLRAMIGAAIGGIYADLALFLPVSGVSALVIDLSVCVGICAVADFRRGRLKELPLYSLVYFAVSGALGGFMTAIFNLLNRLELPLDVESSDGISVWVFAILATLSAIITLVSGRFFKRRAMVDVCEMEILYSGKSIRLKAMTDSGNLLREPISGKPCILVNMSSLEGVVSKNVLKAARSGCVGFDKIAFSDARNLRLIPIKTASGEGCLVGLRADRVELKTKKGSRAVDALIALSDIGNSANGSEALIPSELLV